MIKYKIFQKLLVMLAALLIPATLLFAYANHTSENVVRETLENSASRQLEFSMQQLEQSLRQLERQTVLLVNDSTIKSYASSLEFPEYLDHLLIRKTVEEKLTLQSQAEPLIHNLTVYWPSIREVISTAGTTEFNYEELIRRPKNRWFISNVQGKLAFHLLFTYPSLVKPDLSNTVAIVEMTISSDYLRSVLRGLDASGNGKSLYYYPGAELIGSNEDEEVKLFPRLLEEKVFDSNPSDHPRLTVLKMEGVEYMVQSISIPSFGGTVVSYIQLDEFLSPLQKVNWLVNGSLLFLFIAGIMISYLFFRHFRMPFGYLVRKIESLGAGDYASRALVKSNTEFDYLFERFNDMASRIQSLIENVYEEKVRTREAEYKHLQSQINPHFLYNCLFYIVSMANKSPTAVVSMAKNLSEFYRYITRKPGTKTTLEDEIHLIESYLEVQSLRNKRLTYKIEIPAAMLTLPVPTLLLQPIVENAVIHGLEEKRDSGYILIRGTIIDNQYSIHVDDDGAGLSDEELQSLRERVRNNLAITDEMGCGLWNVHNRLVHRFGSHSGLSFSINEWGGLRVTIQLSSKELEVFQ
ncbi:sensor histidine kinase [Cohnella sp.]|uniref:sensor histidine kinase n=1 Tax=Cohnella sp. TaxID=1883426 RepID=UPI003565F8C8